MWMGIDEPIHLTLVQPKSVGRFQNSAVLEPSNMSVSRLSNDIAPTVKELASGISPVCCLDIRLRCRFKSRSFETSNAAYLIPPSFKQFLNLNSRCAARTVSGFRPVPRLH